MNDELKYKNLIFKFFSKEITDDETDILKAWLFEDPSNRIFFDRTNKLLEKITAANRRFGYMAGRRNICSTFCSLIGFSSSRRITPSNRINNELLVINLAAVMG